MRTGYKLKTLKAYSDKQHEILTTKDYLFIGRADPVKRTIAEAMLVLYKRVRKLALVTSITGWRFHKVLQVLQALDPDIFKKYPKRGGGRPGHLRKAISAEEFEWVVRMHHSRVNSKVIADSLGTYYTRIDFWLWRARRLRRYYTFSIHEWTLAMKREHEQRNLADEDVAWRHTADTLAPKVHIEDEDEDEIEFLLKEYGF